MTSRVYLKCIKHHNSYDSCERCVIRGDDAEGRIVLNECHAQTDELFSRAEYSNHQIGISPLIAAGISCVRTFEFDYIHYVVTLRVVRCLLILSSVFETKK